jgi:hypothetical protein
METTMTQRSELVTNPYKFSALRQQENEKPGGATNADRARVSIHSA